MYILMSCCFCVPLERLELLGLDKTYVPGIRSFSSLRYHNSFVCFVPFVESHGLLRHLPATLRRLGHRCADEVRPQTETFLPPVLTWGFCWRWKRRPWLSCAKPTFTIPRPARWERVGVEHQKYSRVKQHISVALAYDAMIVYHVFTHRPLKNQSHLRGFGSLSQMSNSRRCYSSKLLLMLPLPFPTH